MICALGTILIIVFQRKLSVSAPGRAGPAGKAIDESATLPSLKGDLRAPADKSEAYKRYLDELYQRRVSKQIQPIEGKTEASFQSSNSWFSSQDVFPTLRTNIFAVDGVSVRIMSKKLINTNAVLEDLKADAVLQAELRENLQNYKRRMSTCKTGADQSDILQALGVDPHHKRANERGSYWVFTPHSDGLLPRDLPNVSFSVLAILFDANGKLVNWSTTSRPSFYIP
jgi:hypothetical protein